jgi:hypothetical protein
MADEHDPQQQSSFHWPPTAEELDTIQVVDMQGQPLPLPGTHRHWRTGVAKASIAQLGVLAGSLAAIGIALTSMLAHPAQPAASRAARGQASAVATAAPTPSPRPSPPQTGAREKEGEHAAAAADSLSARAGSDRESAGAPTAVDDSAAFVADSTPAFRPMVTLEIEKPSAADVRPQSRAKARESRSQIDGASAEAAAYGGRDAGGSRPTVAAGAASGSFANDGATAGGRRARAARPQLASAQTRPTRVARMAGRREAPRDPVAKFAVHTGLSVWKAMRVVGRTLKHQGDEEYFATRSAGARRTAKAAGLQAESAPSDR